MATISPDKSRNLINDFLRFTKQIALEIVKEDIEVAIFLIQDKLTEEEISGIKGALQPGVQLVSCLKQKFLLSENNLDFFIELLTECRRIDLANRVREYQEKSVKMVKDAPPIQISEKIPAHNMESLALVIAGQKSSMTLDQLDHIRESIRQALGLKKSQIFYVATEEDKENPLYSKLSLQVPKIDDKIKQLQLDAIDKKPWLTSLKVVELTVDKKSSITIAEKIKGDGRQKSSNGDKEPRPAVDRMQSVLALDPTLKIHCDLSFDTVMAIELSHGVPRKIRRTVLERCETALKVYHSHNQSCNVRLATIRFGNHIALPPRLPNDQQIAFIDKEFSSDLKITSKVNPDAQCGGSVDSGLADALSKVYSLKDGMRREATKLCIVICFLTPKSADLEHYKCAFGYDVIDLGHALASHAIPLYIIGIDLDGVQQHTQENYLLSGLTAITGGRYFQIQDVSLLKELIHCIIKENNSIERNMGTVNDVVIPEIKRQYGDVNDAHLTQFLLDRLSQCCIKIDCIRQRGMSLTPISQISQRVSWADDLNDAIAGVKSLKEHLKENGKVTVAPPKQASNVPKQCSTPAGRSTKQRQNSEPREFKYEKKNPDTEVSARMVRRQIERSAYYRPTT